MASFDEAIPPGQVGTIHAVLDTSTQLGRVRRGLQVVTNDPARPSLRLELLAEVQASVWVLPHHKLNLSNLPARGGPKARMLVRQDPTEQGQLAITDVRTTAPWLRATALRAESRRVVGGGAPDAMPGDWVLEVALGDAAPGTGQHEVRFRTGLPREPEIVVPVTVVVRPPVNLLAQEIVFDASSTDGPQTATIRGLVRAGLADAELSAETAEPSLAVRVERTGRRQFLAEVVWRPGPRPPAGDAAIVLRVGEESARVPVRFVSGG